MNTKNEQSRCDQQQQQQPVSEKQEMVLETRSEEINQLPAAVKSEKVTPMSMLQAARDNNATVEQMKELYELQVEYEKNEARKAYYLAKVAFKRERINITKDKPNSQFGSNYTGIGNLVNTVNGILSTHGLDAHWEPDQSNGLKITCVLVHELGFSESVSLFGEPDKSGAKNPNQELKSAITYLKIQTYEMVTGVASTDDPGDVDGNTPVQLITGEQIANLEALISEVGADKKQCLKMFKVEKLGDLPASKYNKAVKRLQDKGKA